MSAEKDELEIDYDLYDYKLVKFIEGSEAPSKEIDIVYKEWVSFNNKSGICETLFPGPPYGAIKRKDLFKKLNEKSEAPAQWLPYEIEIVGHAKTYDTALSRLEELKKKPFAFTDNENASKKSEEIVQKLKCRATSKYKNKADFHDEVMSLSEEEAEGQQNAITKEKEEKRRNHSTQEEVTKSKEKPKQKRNTDNPFTPKTGLKTPTSWRKENVLQNQSDASPKTFHDFGCKSAIFSGRHKEIGRREKLIDTPIPYSKSNHVEMEILRKVTGMESEIKFLRSELREIKQSIADMHNSEQIRYRQNENVRPMNIHSFTEKYSEITLPAITEQHLMMLSKKLNTDREFSTDFEMAFFSIINRKKTLPVNLANIMRSVVTREIAMNYTAVRKMSDKQIFKISHPKLYSIIYEFLNRTRDGIFQSFGDLLYQLQRLGWATQKSEPRHSSAINLAGKSELESESVESHLFLGLFVYRWS